MKVEITKCSKCGEYGLAAVAPTDNSWRLSPECCGHGLAEVVGETEIEKLPPDWWLRKEWEEYYTFRHNDDEDY